MQVNAAATVTEDAVLAFGEFLRDNERAKATIEKYTTAIRKLMVWLDGREITHALLMEYRESLRFDRAATTVNGAISAINSYLEYAGAPECRLKLLKVQKRVFRPAEKELTKKDFKKLIRTAERLGRDRLLLIMETICSTGIRVSELQYITAEALETGQVEVTLKGKSRTVFLTGSLIRKLRRYAEEQGIVSGSIFLTKNGTPISRKQVWAEMKALCEEAGVNPTCVFPHNLRHLFARCYYEKTHNIVELSDLLGHSSINTTRIYLISTGTEHKRALEELGLVS